MYLLERPMSGSGPRRVRRTAVPSKRTTAFLSALEALDDSLCQRTVSRF